MSEVDELDEPSEELAVAVLALGVAGLAVALAVPLAVAVVYLGGES